jgi:hypothetical protein
VGIIFAFTSRGEGKYQADLRGEFGLAAAVMPAKVIKLILELRFEIAPCIYPPRIMAGKKRGLGFPAKRSANAWGNRTG